MRGKNVAKKSTTQQQNPLTCISRALNQRRLPLYSPNKPSQKHATSAGRGIGRGKGGMVRMSSTLSQQILAEQRAREDASVVQLRHLRRYERNLATQKSIPRRAICREVKAVLTALRPSGEFKIQAVALEAIHESAESFLLAWFEAAYLCTVHANRVTVMQKDFELIKRMKKYRTVLVSD